MGFPDRSPCACEPCDEFALGDTGYCIKCQHHNCGYENPNCPSMERSSKWCDSCERKVETERVHNEWLCEDCRECRSARQSDYNDITCEWCGKMLDLPLVLEDGTRINEPDELSVQKAKSITSAFHIGHKQARDELEQRKENNRGLDEFVS